MLSLRIEAGFDIARRPEGFGALEFHEGQVVALVGATGSGKTRLLADIERLSRGDSPSGRKVWLMRDGAVCDYDEGLKAIGRISQNMQFFLDLSVRQFIEMHCEARSTKAEIKEVIRWTNALAGEPIGEDQPLASLSGGQARALMVADLVLVSGARILLIDEIENAGIDRHEALRFLVRKGRLVFLATHDPLIALRSDCRLVLASGGIRQVRYTTEGERRLAARLARWDREVARLRALLRAGGELA